MSSFTEDPNSTLAMIAKNLDKNEARTRSRAMQVPGSGLSAAASSSSGRSGRGSGSVPSSPAILSTSASSAVHDAELDSFSLRGPTPPSTSFMDMNKLRAALPESSQQLKSSSAAPSAPVQIQVTASASTPSSSSSDSAAVAEAAGDDATGEAGGKKGGRNKAPPAELANKVFEKKPQLTKEERRLKMEMERAIKAGKLDPSAKEQWLKEQLAKAQQQQQPAQSAQAAASQPVQQPQQQQQQQQQTNRRGSPATASTSSPSLSSAQPPQSSSSSSLSSPNLSSSSYMPPMPPAAPLLSATISTYVGGAGNAAIPKQVVPMQHDDASKMAKHARQAVIRREEVPHHKQVSLFTHLPHYKPLDLLEIKLGYSLEDVHPTMIRLGLKYAEGQVVGAIARCVALMEAIKDVLTDFEFVPQPQKTFGKEWNMHLTKVGVRFLVDCRPLATTMGNAIRYIKNQALRLPADQSPEKSKEQLMQLIDDFLTDRIYHAQTGIIDAAEKKIVDDDVVLTYAQYVSSL